MTSLVLIVSLCSLCIQNTSFSITFILLACRPHLSGVCQKPKTLLNDNELQYNYNSTVYFLEV